LHVGGARTALYNWLFARHHGGTFVLRIEDTDISRERAEYREEIFRALAWLGIEEDEGPLRGGPYGPYTQRERLALYREAAERLRAGGHVYPCFCESRGDDDYVATDDEPNDTGRAAHCPCAIVPPAEVERRMRELGRTWPALRFRVDPAATHHVRDLVRGDVVFPPGEVEDFIITKAGGAPLYNFAAVVDDAAMRITHVIRGEEHLSNTPKQVLLYRALGLEVPQFAHLAILLNAERKKLSKRDGATAVFEYRNLGYLPEALRNFLALLGWSPGGDRELMTLNEMIELFDLARVQKHGAVFDTIKLTWMNGEYIKASPLEALADRTRTLLLERPDADSLRTDREHVIAVCTLLRERAKTLAEIVVGGRYFFSRELRLDWDPLAVAKRAGTPEARERLREAGEALREAPGFDRTTVEHVVRGLAERSGHKAGDYIQPLRVATTGFAVSPGIFEVCEVLGREIVLGRVAAFLAAHEPVEVPL
jgi:glutamyl-tRNA synthetase